MFGENPRRTAVRVLVLAAASFITLKWVLRPIWTEGSSMLPTYASRRFNFVNRLAYSGTKPSRGDVVAIQVAGPNVVYVKRVIGLPGERIAVRGGTVFINDSPLTEPYVKYRRDWDVPEVTLGSGEYFLMGDNRGTSDFGRTEAERILGKVVF